MQTHRCVFFLRINDIYTEKTPYLFLCDICRRGTITTYTIKFSLFIIFFFYALFPVEGRAKLVRAPYLTSVMTVAGGRYSLPITVQMRESYSLVFIGVPLFLSSSSNLSSSRSTLRLLLLEPPSWNTFESWNTSSKTW